MNPFKPIRRLLRWHDREPDERLLLFFRFVMILIVGVALLCCLLTVLPGCQSPQPIPDCTRSPRLMEVLRFQTCMTGPWPHRWRWLADDCQPPVRTEPLRSLGVLNLPDGCVVFDADGDGDVDLADYARMQNDD